MTTLAARYCTFFGYVFFVGVTPASRSRADIHSQCHCEIFQRNCTLSHGSTTSGLSLLILLILGLVFTDSFQDLVDRLEKLEQEVARDAPLVSITNNADDSIQNVYDLDDNICDFDSISTDKKDDWELL